MSEHEVSAPPSPPPPPPSEPEEARRDTGRHAVVPRERVASIAEVGRRAETPIERVTRIAEANRDGLRRVENEVVGRPSSTRADGTSQPATGLWAVLEPLRTDVAFLVQRERDKQQQRTGVVGWVAKRADNLIDRYLPILLLAGAALLAKHFHW